MHAYFSRFIIALFLLNSIAAQSNGVVVGGKWPSQIFISDVNGRPFESRFADVDGTPYLHAAYKYADITLKQGRKFIKVKAKLNLVTQETIFESANGVEGYMEAGMVKELSYTDTTEQGMVSYRFQTGFPAVDKQTDKHFYQILSEGKCRLLKSIVKKVVERKTELSGEVAKEFETSENSYLFVNGEMRRFKKDKEFVLSAMTDKLPAVNQFITENKTNFKNMDQVIRLLDFYNSL